MIKYAVWLFLLCSSTFIYAETSSEIKNTQNAFNGLSSILSRAEPEIFGGMYFQNEPEFKVKLLVTDVSEKDRLLGYVNAKVKGKIDESQLSKILDIVEVEYSYAELQVIREQYEDALKSKGIRFDSYTSVKENKAIFRILNDKQNEQIAREILTKSTKARASSAIKLEIMSKLAEPYASSYGGYLLNDSMGGLQCTIGFNRAPNPFNGNPGAVTAAHCKGSELAGDDLDEMYTHDGLQVILAEPDSAGPDEDVQVLGAPGTGISFLSNKIKTCSAGCLHEITRRQ